MLESIHMDDLKYWVAFNRIKGIGRVRYTALERHFGNLKQAWNADASELRRAGLDRRAITNITSKRREIDPDAEMDALQRLGIKAITWNDTAYPAPLKEIYDLPPVLYSRGSLEGETEWAIAVVGTRRATAYGREMTEILATDLAHNGITVISGLARGIDAVAHRAALKAGGRTIAVQACGLDMVYPSEHVKLAQEIMEQGALVSDYPLGTLPRADHFPRRNRIMSGLCLGTLVIEADHGSGALITADYALEHNREVFSVPGSALSTRSQGTNRLIREGAKLVTRVEDILEELNLTMVPHQMEMRELAPPTDTESLLLDHISHEPIHIDEVQRLCNLPIATVSSTLAMMELKGIVKQAGPMNYVMSREAQASYRATA